MTQARPKRTRLRAAVKADQAVRAQLDIKGAQEAIGYVFKDDNLLVRAMTHPSALQNPSVNDTNQRLEFLGDRILNLAIAERLFDRRKTESEGELAPRLNLWVKKEACADAMRHLDLGRFVIMSPSEVSLGGRDRDSTLGDACEAIIAAIYLDGGLSAATKFIERGWAAQFKAPIENSKDPKTRLQEWAQKRGLDLPKYELKSRSGPDHQPIYEIEVEIPEHGNAIAKGPSKRDAERAAARDLIEKLDVEA